MGETGRTAEHSSKRYLMIFALVALSAGSGLYFGKPIIFGIDKIARCRATKGYGDYEHGAFFFDMEPAAHDALERTQVVFLGNSISQFAFSTKSAGEIFQARGIYY